VSTSTTGIPPKASAAVVMLSDPALSDALAAPLVTAS
jgi:hypothetical protein